MDFNLFYDSIGMLNPINVSWSWIITFKIDKSEKLAIKAINLIKDLCKDLKISILVSTPLWGETRLLRPAGIDTLAEKGVFLNKKTSNLSDLVETCTKCDLQVNNNTFQLCQISSTCRIQTWLIQLYLIWLLNPSQPCSYFCNGIVALDKLCRFPLRNVIY